MTRSRAAALTVLAVLALTGTACGGDDDEAGDAAATTTDGTIAEATDGTTDPTTDDTTPDTVEEQADPPEQVDPADPCSVVSDDVVTSVLRVPIERRDPGSSSAVAYGCVKGTAIGSDPGTFVSVQVFVGSVTLLDQAQAQADAVAVPGVGDRALFIARTASLFVADGTDSILIQVYEQGAPGSQEDAVTVAEDVLARRG